MNPQDTAPLTPDRSLPPPPAPATVPLPPGYLHYPGAGMTPQHLPPGYMPYYPYPPGYGYPQGYPLPPTYQPMMPPQAPPEIPGRQETIIPAALHDEAVPVAKLADPPTAVSAVPAPPETAREESPRSTRETTPPPGPPTSLPMVPPAQSLPKDQPPPRGRFRAFWQRIGGGSLTFSLALHSTLLVLAGLVAFTSTLTTTNVDFLPGGGGDQGRAASQDLAQKSQQKRRQALAATMPMRKLVSTSLTAAITLPEVPLETLDLPSESLPMSAGSMSSGGFGSLGGGGGGFSGGMGMGSAKGFVGMTLFGKIGGDGLPGVFYDLKQTPDRAATAYAGEINEAEYAGIINRTAAKKFAGKVTSDFFHSTQKMSFTYLLIPYMAATEGPKSFRVEHEVQPRGWFVHYGGQILPPAPGDYRFVGMFDDALVVYINGKAVLDGSWYSIVDHGEKRRDESIRQDFGGPVVPGTGNRKAYAGKWVRLDGSTRIDIVVGERPGGRVGGLLLVQAKKGKYETRSDGTPILPVFSTVKMDNAGLARLREFSGPDNAFEVAAETPVFTLRKPLFDDGEERLDSRQSNPAK